MRKSARIFELLLLMMPAVLFFSYHPVIFLGANSSMNFELSLPLLWLAVFDIFALILMIRARKFSFKGILKEWKWLLFPIFVSLSLFYTANLARGVLTVGVLWLIYFAVFAFFSLREFLGPNFRRNFFRVLFLSGIVAILWCILQCFLDIFGVGREYSLMCAGCTTEMFGFPHPNGFAIEPQFMGNLLLAPAIVSAAMMSGEGISKRSVAALFIFAAGLFLTFSRGAIYAFILAVIFMIVFEVFRRKNWRVFLVLPVILGSFLFTLNLQGIFAQISRTNDTYFSGVTKVLNHLSLGVIDIRTNGEELKTDGAEDSKASEEDVSNGDDEGAEKTMGMDVGAVSESENEAIFDGYVEESTNIRLELSGAALKVFGQDVRTVLFGVGIGGAGEAMYLAGETESPKEIVQNQYVSLLLETGVIGVLLMIFTVGLVVRVVLKTRESGAILSLLIAYGVSLLFFAGLPNALQIYLMPAGLVLASDTKRRG